jgi:predicted nucleotidyltransferase
MAKTALDLTREEWKQYHPGRNIRTWPPERRELAWQQARQAARLLREQFGATRVVVFGSLAHNLWYSERSDIDMAVWGVAPQNYFKAVASVNTAAAGFEINLVDMATARPSMLKAVKREGVDV